MDNKKDGRWSIVGYMGAGKTTLGRILAEHTGKTFIDLDEVIIQKAGSSIPELFESKGEIAFRKIEREALLECLAEEDIILATGGGTPCYYDNMEVLSHYSHTVYLDLSISKLAERLHIQRSERPILPDQGDLTEFVAKHLFERRHYYLQADVVFRPEKMDISDLIIALGK